MKFIFGVVVGVVIAPFVDRRLDKIVPPLTDALKARIEDRLYGKGKQ